MKAENEVEHVVCVLALWVLRMDKSLLSDNELGYFMFGKLIK